jgi:predicted aspartyl protease
MNSVPKKLRLESRRLGALCLAMFATCAVAEDAPVKTAAPATSAIPAKPAAPATASCRYVNFANLPVTLVDLTPTADGSVNKDKTTMLIDSGAQITLLTKAEVTKLGLSHPAPVGKHKKAAAAKKDERVTVDELSIGSIHLGKTTILSLQSSTDQANYGALIGADFLFQHDIEFALADRQIKFFNPVACDTGFLAYWDNNASTVPLETMSATDFRPVVTVEVNGQKLRALIDTAAPMSIINLAAAARAGITPQSNGVKPLTQPGSAGKHAASAWVAPFASFTIGGEAIKNVNIPIMDLRDAVKTETESPTPDMLLGADFLNAHRVLFAVSQHLLYFSFLGGNVFRIDTSAQLTGSTAPK